MKQEQFELFKSSLKDSDNKGLPRLPSFVNINLSLENIILLAIFALMLIVLSFSLGVENGKRRFSKEGITTQAINTQTTRPVVIDKTPVLKKATVPPVKNTVSAENPDKELTAVKKYTIQIASLERQVSVEGEVNKLKKIGYEIWIRPSGRYNTLCVGHFVSKEEAEAIRKSLQKIYDDCFIRRI